MVGSCSRPINILKPEEIYATFVINKFLKMWKPCLLAVLLRDLAGDFRVVFRELAPSRVLRNQLARGKILLGATLRAGSSALKVVLRPKKNNSFFFRWISKLC